jgi:hypothetical protein
MPDVWEPKLRPLTVAVLGNAVGIVVQLPEILTRSAVNGFMHVPVLGGFAALALAVATPVAVLVLLLAAARGGDRGNDGSSRATRWAISAIAVVLSLAVMQSRNLALRVIADVLHVRFFVR